MTTVRIAHVEPRPGRQPDGFRIHSFLIVLADDPGGRALPIWLTGPQGHGLWQIVAPGAGPPIHEAEAQTSRLLQAVDVAVTGAGIDELDAAITAGPRRGRPDAGASARIESRSATPSCPSRPQQAPERVHSRGLIYVLVQGSGLPEPPTGCLNTYLSNGGPI